MAATAWGSGAGGESAARPATISSENGVHATSGFREVPPEGWAEKQSEIREAIVTTSDCNEWEAPRLPASALVPNAKTSAAATSLSSSSSRDSDDVAIILQPRRPLRLIAGCDISFIKDDNVNALSALVVLTYPELNVVYSSFHDIELTEPYIPGFLAFREAQHILDLIKELRDKRPDLEQDCLLVDGNGLLHPRGCGLACHLGVLADMPTIGIGKNLLYIDGLTKAKVKAWLAEEKKEGGDGTTSVLDGMQRKDLVGESGKTHGAAVAVAGVSTPIYVSVGHKVSLDTAVAVAIACSRHRIPEPVRQADLLSRDVLRKRAEMEN